MKFLKQKKTFLSVRMTCFSVRICTSVHFSGISALSHALAIYEDVKKLMAVAIKEETFKIVKALLQFTMQYNINIII